MCFYTFAMMEETFITPEPQRLPVEMLVFMDGNTAIILL